jgi:hypothetical protein
LIKLAALPPPQDPRHDAGRVARWKATKHLVDVWLERGFAHCTAVSLAWHGIENERDVAKLGAKELRAQKIVGPRAMKLMQKLVPELVKGRKTGA